jgi:uncharacterized protein YkwD
MRWLAGWILAAGSSATACSGDVGVEGEPEDTPRRALPPAMTATDDGADMEAEDGDSTTTEGNPDPSGIDTSGMTGTQQPDETDLETDPVTPVDVPATSLCADVADWDPEWVEFEEDVLTLVNESRSRPADCGAEGMFAAAPPLSMDPILRCSSRLHSLDMFDRNFFEHTNPDGVDPFERMQDAGFVGNAMGENIAQGQVTPAQVMQSWMDSDGHCSNVMSPNFSLIGVGFHPGAGQRGIGSNYWTQNFGAPRRAGGGRAN